MFFFFVLKHILVCTAILIAVKQGKPYRMSEIQMETIFSDGNRKCFSWRRSKLLLYFQFVEACEILILGLENSTTSQKVWETGGTTSRPAVPASHPPKSTCGAVTVSCDMLRAPCSGEQDGEAVQLAPQGFCSDLSGNNTRESLLPLPVPTAPQNRI